MYFPFFRDTTDDLCGGIRSAFEELPDSEKVILSRVYDEASRPDTVEEAFMKAEELAEMSIRGVHDALDALPLRLSARKRELRRMDARLSM